MFTQQLYWDTLEQIADTNDESYPFDMWKRDAYFFLKKYARKMRSFQRDHDYYVSSKEIKIVPACTVKEGMEGYEGEYSLPDDMAEFIRLEISHDSNCFKEAERSDLNTHKCGSEYYDDCCNCCKICHQECLPTYEFEDNLLKLKWLPTKVGRMKIWYYRKPKEITDGKDDEIDFDDEFADLISLSCALRYMAARHEGQYGNLAIGKIKEELNELKVEFDKSLQRRHGVIPIIPISKT